MMMRYRLSQDLSASRIHASFVFNFVGCTTPTIFQNFVGIAGTTDVSNFLRAFLMVSLNSVSFFLRRER